MTDGLLDLKTYYNYQQNESTSELKKFWNNNTGHQLRDSTQPYKKPTKYDSTVRLRSQSLLFPGNLYYTPEIRMEKISYPDGDYVGEIRNFQRNGQGKMYFYDDE